MPVGRCGCDWYASQEFNSSCVRAVRRAVRLPASLWLRIRATFLENASAFCRVTVAAASSETSANAVRGIAAIQRERLRMEP